MIDGITILSSELGLTSFGCTMIFLGSMFTVIVLTLSVLLIPDMLGGLFDIPQIIISIIIISICTVVSISCFVVGAKDKTTYYKVTIDDSVSMQEFNSKYKVVDQEGNMFEIIERTDIND